MTLSAMLWLTRLDLMMLEAFSNLNYAVILCYEKVAPVNFYLLFDEDTLREGISLKSKLFEALQWGLKAGSHKRKSMAPNLGPYPAHNFAKTKMIKYCSHF